MSYLLKLRRAEEHLERLEQSVKAWNNSEPYSFFTEFDPETFKHSCRMNIVKPFPDDWPLIAGDFLTNIRATLDHLVFALAEQGKGTALTEAEARGCCFPIHGPKPPPTSRLDSALPYVDPGVRKAIEALQPAASSDYFDHILWGLSVLCNIDKHRALHAVTTLKKNFKMQVSPNVVVSQYESLDGVVDEGAVLATYVLAPASPSNTSDAHVDVDWDMIEIWDAPTASRGIIPIDQGLRVILYYVKVKVLPNLEPYLA